LMQDWVLQQWLKE
jgi:hypothetical protein